VSHLVLGVTGSIAAYKAVDLASKCVQAGHAVDVVMTRAALRFVRPLSFSALTHRRVFTDRSWGRGSTPQDHLRATGEADLLVVAPCTANALARIAHGLAGNVLTATVLGATCPLLLAPAMNVRMWENPRTRRNVRVLEEDGVSFVGPETGWLSEGEVGPGRMSEPEAILEEIGKLLG
jgi:phosphopantothenoylcysteine decarboxylase/phosphopantothenate--cysteine ligase